MNLKRKRSVESNTFLFFVCVYEKAQIKKG